MRNVFSALVLAASFALLVPDNQALRAAEGLRTAAPAASLVGADVADRARTDHEAPPSDVAWLLAMGFLGVVIARRLRPD
jgi:hypothetical protein